MPIQLLRRGPTAPPRSRNAQRLRHALDTTWRVLLAIPGSYALRATLWMGLFAALAVASFHAADLLRAAA